MSEKTLFCELCGSPIRGKSYRVKVEGAVLTVCEKCYRKLLSRPGSIEVVSTPATARTAKKSKTSKPPRRSRYVEYEVIDNYSEVIREARTRKGISISLLAQKVMEKENVLRRIEQGRLRPTIDLAHRLEKALGVKLLEPVVDEEEPLSLEGGGEELTLGDLVNLRRGKGR